MNKTLFLFIDESGNFDFSPSGTKYFILTALSTLNPFSIASSLLDLRYQLLPNYACGSALEENGYFHAAEDAQLVRDAVFSTIIKGKGDLRIDAVIAQKNKANPKFHGQYIELYERMGEALVKYTFNRAVWKNYDHVVLVFSSLFDKKKRGILKQTFKALIKSFASKPYSLYFHDSKFDFCSQAVDYFGWAIYRKWESLDKRSYNLVKQFIKSEFPIFGKGTKIYYPFKK
ncbi:hypothetical protein FJZ40_03100 [Candidatus Shapirobacteria bacterium]|nr:hypothetical protein [Candidatus Shapirobacteria bacterium]